MPDACSKIEKYNPAVVFISTYYADVVQKSCQRLTNDRNLRNTTLRVVSWMVAWLSFCNLLCNLNGTTTSRVLLRPSLLYFILRGIIFPALSKFL